MDVHHILISFFFLTLQDGNTGLTNAEELIRTGTEGGNITVLCSFTFSGSRKFFCKGDCTTGNILVETTNDRAQSGRYSIEYKEGSFPSTQTLMYVSITQLKKSDSGWYRCSLARTLLPDAHYEIKISVTEASSQPNTTLQAFTTSSSSSETTKQPETQSSAVSGPVLVVSLILVVMITILSVTVLIFCRKRTNKFKGSPVETTYANVRESRREHEEIGDSAEVSTVYTLTNLNRVKTTDEYSLATATCAQKQTEDKHSELVYTEVDLPKGEASSLHSAPCANRDNVVYSEPRVEASSPSHSEDASAPLYSTIDLP